MSNICNNTLEVFSETPENIEYIKGFFDDWGDVDQDDSCNITVYFESKWDFPEKEMNELFNNLPNKNDIQMTCLSVEWGCYYCAFHSCDENGWQYQG